MKKLGLMMAAMLMCGCANAESVNVMGATCEVVKSADAGAPAEMIVRCPANDALREIQAKAPDAMFWGLQLDFALDDMKSNPGDFIYVDVIPDGLPCGGATEYRVLVSELPSDLSQYWAVQHCAE